MEIAVYISVHKNLIIFLSFRMHVSNAKQVASKKRVTTMLLVEDIPYVNFVLMITISRDSSCAIYSCAIYSGKFDFFFMVL